MSYVFRIGRHSMVAGSAFACLLFASGALLLSADEATSQPGGNAPVQEGLAVRPAVDRAEQRISELEQKTKMLEAELFKLRSHVPDLRKDDELRRMVKEMTARRYPNPVPLHQDEGRSSYAVPSPPQKNAASGKRRDAAWESYSSLGPIGSIDSPRETVDGYYRTNAGADVMTNVARALERLDAGIRFSQNSDQLSVRATRAGHEIVRSLIRYYEAGSGKN